MLACVMVYERLLLLRLTPNLVWVNEETKLKVCTCMVVWVVVHYHLVWTHCTRLSLLHTRKVHKIAPTAQRLIGSHMSYVVVCRCNHMHRENGMALLMILNCIPTLNGTPHITLLVTQLTRVGEGGDDQDDHFWGVLS